MSLLQEKLGGVSRPRLSVIIPCYNHGAYLREAIESVERCKDKELYEIIINNDGSNDPGTLSVLNELKQEGYFVIDQPNLGLGAARNNAIKRAKGDYILPLDSDNKIRPEYITRSIEILDKNSDVGLVYGNAEYFGEKTGPWKVGTFVLQKMMVGNYIDACAVYRKGIWENLGGYDEKMPISGHEDWDLWLRIAFNGHKFYYLDEVLFEYRVLGNSMLRSMDKKKIREQNEYIFEKHALKYYLNFREYYLLHNIVFEESRFKSPLKAVLFALKLYKVKVPPPFFAE